MRNTMQSEIGRERRRKAKPPTVSMSEHLQCQKLRNALKEQSEVYETALLKIFAMTYDGDPVRAIAEEALTKYEAR